MFWVHFSLPLEFDVFGRVPFSGVFNWCPLFFGRASGSLLKCLFEPYLFVSSCLLLYLLVQVVGVLEFLVISGGLRVVY